jgi:hypothetical protein
MARQKVGWQERFIAALRAYGVVEEACFAAGVCTGTAYHMRKRDASFAAQWDKALVDANERITVCRPERIETGGCRRCRGMWQDKFIEELRVREGETRRAANITRLGHIMRASGRLAPSTASSTRPLAQSPLRMLRLRRRQVLRSDGMRRSEAVERY